jgi:hypothetical protein
MARKRAARRPARKAAKASKRRRHIEVSIVAEDQGQVVVVREGTREILRMPVETGRVEKMTLNGDKPKPIKPGKRSPRRRRTR